MPHLAKYEMHFPAAPFGPEPSRTVPGVVFDAVAATAKRRSPSPSSPASSRRPSSSQSGARDVATQRGLKVLLYLDTSSAPRLRADRRPIKDANPDLCGWVRVGLDGNLVLESSSAWITRRDGTSTCSRRPARWWWLRRQERAVEHVLRGASRRYQHPVGPKFAAIYHERAAKAGVPYTNVDTPGRRFVRGLAMLEAAVTATKSLDDKLMAQWLRKNQVPTIVGRFRFDGPNNYGDDLTQGEAGAGRQVDHRVAEGVRGSGRASAAVNWGGSTDGQFGIGQGIKRSKTSAPCGWRPLPRRRQTSLPRRHAVIVRSQHAHARLRAADTSRRCARPVSWPSSRVPTSTASAR